MTASGTTLHLVTASGTTLHLVTASGTTLHLVTASGTTLHLELFLQLPSYSHGCCVVDASYVDPLGPAVERPRTAALSRRERDDEFADEELGDDLLPE